MKRNFYLKYLDKQKEEEIKKQLDNQLNLQSTNVTIENDTDIKVKMLSLVFDILARILKIFFYVLVMSLISFAITILINSQLRDYIFGEILSIYK